MRIDKGARSEFVQASVFGSGHKLSRGYAYSTFAAMGESFFECKGNNFLVKVHLRSSAQRAAVAPCSREQAQTMDNQGTRQ